MIKRIKLHTNNNNNKSLSNNITHNYVNILKYNVYRKSN